MPRGAEFHARPARVVFQKPAPARGRNAPKPPDRIERLDIDAKPSERLILDAPVLSSMVAEREKRRPVALAAIPPRVLEAFLSIEDRRYYYHPGVDPIRLTVAV